MTAVGTTSLIGGADGAVSRDGVTSTEAGGGRASVEEPDEVTDGAATVVATDVAAAAGAVDGRVGPENMEPTLVVPKNRGTGGASDPGGEGRRAASEAGRTPALEALGAEADMSATLGLG
jgi:hypothetical protein